MDHFIQQSVERDNSVEYDSPRGLVAPRLSPDRHTIEVEDVPLYQPHQPYKYEPARPAGAAHRQFLNPLANRLTMDTPKSVDFPSRYEQSRASVPHQLAGSSSLPMLETIEERRSSQKRPPPRMLTRKPSEPQTTTNQTLQITPFSSKSNHTQVTSLKNALSILQNQQPNHTNNHYQYPNRSPQVQNPGTPVNYYNLPHLSRNTLR